MCSATVVWFTPGGEEHGNLLLGGGLHVDLVDADAVLADDLQPGQGLVDDRAGDGVVAAEEGVEAAGQLQHAGLGQGSALADDFKAGAL